MHIDPESFKGKLYLLIIDKIVIGAFLALAFLGYSWWSTQENRAYEARLREVDLEFRRAEYIKELVPIVLNDGKDAVFRAHALSALIETESIAANSAVNLAQQVLLADVLGKDWDRNTFVSPHETFLLETMLNVMPEALPNVLNVYIQTIKRHRASAETKNYGDSLVLNNITGFWIALFKKTIEERDDSKLELLNSTEFLIGNIEEIDRIVPSLSERDAESWAARKPKALRILGNLRLLQSREQRKHNQATHYFESLFLSEQSNSDIYLSVEIPKLIQRDGIASPELARKAMDIVLRREELSLHRQHPGEKRNPIENRFNAMSEYLVWSCSFPQVSMVLEQRALKELEKFYQYLAQSSLDYDNYPIEWILVRCLIKSTTESFGSESSQDGEDFLEKLFMLEDNKLRKAGLTHYRDKWLSAKEDLK